MCKIQAIEKEKIDTKEKIDAKEMQNELWKKGSKKKPRGIHLCGRF